MVKIGLLFQIVGFLMASFFIAVLKIAAIKRIAERIKTFIVQLAEKDNPDLADIMVRVLIVSAVRVIWTKKAIRTTIDNWMNIRHHNKLKRWQFPILVIPIILHIGQAVFLTSLVALVLVFDILGKFITWIANKMSKGEVITNIMIIFGTIIALVGLIIELIGAW